MTETTHWIPCDTNVPGHRPPTEADADDDRQIELQLPHPTDGFFYSRQDFRLHPYIRDDSGEAIHAVAWRPLPKSRPAEPYVPPEPEPRKPREVWYVFGNHGDLIIGCQTESLAQEYTRHSGGNYCQMREVMPGDPTPEDVADVIAGMKSIGHRASAHQVNRWIKKLGGTP